MVVSFDNAAREVFIESMKGVIPFETVGQYDIWEATNVVFQRR